MKLFLFFLISNLISANETIKIGLAGNFSTVSASTNNPTYNPIESAFLLALEKYKPKLDKKNIRVEYVKLDYQNKNELVLKTANEASEKRLDAVIGYIYSNHALLAAPYFVRNKIPLILPTATSTALNQFDSYVYRTCYDDSSQAKVLYQIALDRELKNVLVVTIPDCAYCKSLSSAFISSNKNNSINIQAIDINIEDMNSLNLEMIRRFRPEGILVATHEKEAGQIVSHLLNKNVSPKLWLGGDGWGNVQSLFFKLIQPKKIDAFTVSHWFKDIKIKESINFYHTFKQKYQLEPADSAALVYESSTFLFEAILNSNKKDINDRLLDQKSIEGILGKIIMNSRTKPRKKIVVLKQSSGVVDFFKLMDTGP